VGLVAGVIKRLGAFVAEVAEEARAVAPVPDEVLVGTTLRSGSPRYEIEMVRRLKGSVEALTAELQTFRESSDVAAGKLERLTKVLIWFTIVLVILTLAAVGLTAALLVTKG
jgi:hypothetical protein